MAINVSHCERTDVGAESLARAQELNINDNSISNNVIAHIATAFQINNILETLTIWNMNITDEGVMLLSSSHGRYCSLVFLSLTWPSTQN